MMFIRLLFLACEGGRVRLLVMLCIPPQPLESCGRILIFVALRQLYLPT